MFNLGDRISFHGFEETFEWVNDVERYLDDVTTYEIKEILDDNTIAILNDSGRLIQANVNEFQIHTRESLRNLLTSNKHKYAAICNKVRQLYRKHNNSDSSFKFQGV